MANCKEEFEYMCSDDCKQSGCPKHTATLTFQSTSGILKFKHAYGEIYMDKSVLNAFETLLKRMRNYRADL